MQVILLQDVEKVGLRGDVVEVARGYARNFLLPRRLAEQASPGKIADLERREAQRARHEASTVDQAREVATALEGTILRFEMKAGPTGALFGSVTPTNIVDELWRTQKIRIDRRKVELAEPIKRIGRHAVPIDLFADVRVELQTHVVPEGGELPPEPDPAESTEATAPEEPTATEADPGPTGSDADPTAAEDPAGDEPAGDVDGVEDAPAESASPETA